MFGSVTRELAANRDQLNQADTYNHNHGDNMVDIFGTITEAAKTKKNAEASEQLAYAAEMFGQHSNSGSAQLYQEGLVKASQQLKGQQVDSRNLTTLISTLMGAEQTAKPTPQGGSGDMLGALLGRAANESPNHRRNTVQTANQLRGPAGSTAGRGAANHSSPNHRLNHSPSRKPIPVTCLGRCWAG